MSFAPDFDPVTGYPNEGERLGPAWQAMWDALDVPGWVSSAVLLDAAGDLIAPRTAQNIIRMAVKRRLLERQPGYVGRGHPASYRRAEAL